MIPSPRSMAVLILVIGLLYTGAGGVAATTEHSETRYATNSLDQDYVNSKVSFGSLTSHQQTETNGTTSPERTPTTSASGEERERDVKVWLGDQGSNGSVVTVETAVLPQGGFVAVHTDAYSATLNQTYNTTERVAPESVIGVSRYLEPGRYENLEIHLSEPISETQTLVVIAYHDTDADQHYEFVESNASVDTPYQTPYIRGRGGKAVVSGPALGTGSVAIGVDRTLRNLGHALGLSGEVHPDGETAAADGSSQTYQSALLAGGFVFALASTGLVVYRRRW